MFSNWINQMNWTNFRLEAHFFPDLITQKALFLEPYFFFIAEWWFCLSTLQRIKMVFVYDGWSSLCSSFIDFDSEFMEEQFVLRVPPSVAERIERLLNENASSSEDPSLDLSFSGKTNLCTHLLVQSPCSMLFSLHLLWCWMNRLTSRLLDWLALEIDQTVQYGFILILRVGLIAYLWPPKLSHRGWEKWHFCHWWRPFSSITSGSPLCSGII